MNKNEYVVKKGETLWEISKKIYGTGELYHIIAKENKISNPDTIQNGQIIKIPDVEIYTEKEVLEEAEKCEEYKKEIDRLNNIINELEEIINYEIQEWKDTDDELMKARVQEDKHILEVIEELKEE